MQSLLKPEPALPYRAPRPAFSPAPVNPPAEQTMMPNNYVMEQQYPSIPVAQMAFNDYFRQTMNNPSWAPGGASNPAFAAYPNNQDLMQVNTNMSEMMRQHFLQQQRLTHNHERLLERYQQLREPRASEFRPFGASSLPGRNYNEYLDMVQGDYGWNNSFVAMSRARTQR